MVYAHDLNSRCFVVDPVDDSIDPASGDHVTVEFSEQWFADLVWVVEKWSNHEIDNCGSDLLGEAGEISFG